MPLALRPLSFRRERRARSTTKMQAETTTQMQFCAELMPSAGPQAVWTAAPTESLSLSNYVNMQAVETAAPTGKGLAELEEAILLQAELMELRASASGAAEGIIVEARVAKGLGPIATVIVKRGALKVFPDIFPVNMPVRVMPKMLSSLSSQ